MCVVATALYLVVCAASYVQGWTDENVHMYVADQVAHGERLYRDIHSARPPLAIGFLVAFLKLGLPPLVAARTAVAVATIGVAGVLLWGGRRLWGVWAGVAAYAFTLLSPEAARQVAFTGIHTVALGATACAVIAVVGSPVWSGVVGGLALASGQHALPIVGLAFAYLLFRDRPSALKFALAAIASLGAVVGIAVAAGGAGIYDDLIAHHLYHVTGETPSEDVGLLWSLRNTLEDTLPIVACVAWAIAVPLACKPRRIGPEHWLFAFAVGHVATVLVMTGGLPLYLYVANPLCALVGGLGLVRCVRWLVATRRRLATGLAAFALVGATWVAWWDVGRRYSASDTDGRSFSWIPYVRYPTLIWLQHMTVVGRITDDIANRLAPDDTIFGHAMVAAPVALETGHHMSAQLADLPPRSIELGLITREKIVQDIEADRVKFYITPRWKPLFDPYFQAYLRRCYTLRTIFRKTHQPDGGGIPDILEFEHIERRPCQ